MRSITLQATHDHTEHKTFVFYSDKRPEDAAFSNELGELSRPDGNVTMVATMAEPERSRQPWTGETDFIDRTPISKYVDNLTLPVYYPSGPADMVSSMRGVLDATGVDDDDIRTEEFTGY